MRTPPPTRLARAQPKSCTPVTARQTAGEMASGYGRLLRGGAERVAVRRDKNGGDRVGFEEMRDVGDARELTGAVGSPRHHRGVVVPSSSDESTSRPSQPARVERDLPAGRVGRTSRLDSGEGINRGGRHAPCVRVRSMTRSASEDPAARRPRKYPSIVWETHDSTSMWTGLEASPEQIAWHEPTAITASPPPPTTSSSSSSSDESGRSVSSAPPDN